MTEFGDFYGIVQDLQAQVWSLAYRVPNIETTVVVLEIDASDLIYVENRYFALHSISGHQEILLVEPTVS